LELAFLFDYFTEKKHQDDPDDDSGMGTSIFTDTKSTIFSEVSYYQKLHVHVILLVHIPSFLYTRIVWIKS